MRPLKAIAPEYDPKLGWPISGLAYVAAFMAPFSAGPQIGLLAKDWQAAGIGLLGGIGVTILNWWLLHGLLSPLVARSQRLLLKRIPRILANSAVFAWAFASSAISMLVPVAIFGDSLLQKIK